mmetsp:Transcript_8037/g.23586  ORF Transcript_8037/g.23586 Transcript_8037/m.23586 type:complete len:259 (-) Transcript_8037:444-1220(-)
MEASPFETGRRRTHHRRDADGQGRGVHALAHTSDVYQPWSMPLHSGDQLATPRLLAVHNVPCELGIEGFFLECEVVFVEVLDAHVAILAAACVALAVRGHLQRVDGPKVALDGAELVLEDEVKEDGVELAHLRICRRHAHRVLSAAHHHVRRLLVGRDVRRVERAVRGVHFEALEGVHVEELGRAILGGGDEEGVVPRELDVDNLARVRVDLVDLLASVGVPDPDGGIVTAGDNSFVKGTPEGPVDLAVVARELEQRL